MTPDDTILPFEEDDRDAASVPDGDPSFEALDPGCADPGYWDRFQQRTLALVEPELARRRRAGEQITVSEVVTSWSRTVVPVAMAAAAAAVMVLLTHPAEPDAEAGRGGAMAEAPARVVGAEEPVSPEDATDTFPTLDGGPLLTLEESGPTEMPVVLTAATGGF